MLRQTALISWTLINEAARSVRHNQGLALLSLVLAIALWFYIYEDESEARTGLFPTAIPVEAINVPNGLAVASDLGTVTIRISASERRWEDITAADVRAAVDLSTIPAGQHEVPVRVEALNERAGLRILEVFPNRITVRLEPLARQSVPVTVSLTGTPAQGYEAGTVEVSPSQATISGPESAINKVQLVVAEVNLAGATTDIGRSVQLVPRDDQGSVVFQVRVEPSTADVTVPIEQEVFNKTYVVSPSIRGSPQAGYRVTSVEVDPPSVTVFGTLEALQGLSVLSTRDVSIDGANSTLTRRVQLALPEGASASGVTEVQVKVNIEPAPGEIVLAVAPRWTGLGQGLAVASVTPMVQVRLSGPLTTLQGLRPQDIAATVDLAGLSEGTHLLAPRVQAPSGVQVVEVSPAEAEVVLVRT